MSLNKHVAVKCNYNNGGERNYVGFSGTCSEDVIKINTQTSVWCSQSTCGCKQYVNSGFKGNRPVDPYGAGHYHNGFKKGQPKRANLVAGGVAVLTTRFPGDIEEDRKIVGLYKIGKVMRKFKLKI